LTPCKGLTRPEVVDDLGAIRPLKGTDDQDAVRGAWDEVARDEPVDTCPSAPLNVGVLGGFDDLSGSIWGLESDQNDRLIRIWGTALYLAAGDFAVEVPLDWALAIVDSPLHLDLEI